MHSAKGVEGNALVLEFDLAKTAGYAAATRQLPTTLPEDYEISFWMRAEAGRNHFEVKFVDASGDNVWWFRRANYQFSGDWQQVRIKRRQIDFAWGPTTDRTLRQFQSIEFVLERRRRRRQGQPVVRSPVAEAAARRSAPLRRRRREHRPKRTRHTARRSPSTARRARCGAAREPTPAPQTFEIDLQGRARVRRHRDRLGARAARAALFDRDVARRQPLDEGSHHRREQWRPRLAPDAGVGSALHPRDDARSGPRRRHRRAVTCATWSSALRRTRSSARWRSRPDAAVIRGRTSTSRSTGRSSASTATRRRACCPRTARSKCARAAISIEPFVRTRSGLAHVGRRRPSVTRSPTATCRSRASSGSIARSS